MNKMEEVAILLGVKLHEDFDIIGYGCNPHRLNEGGIYDCEDNLCQARLTDLLTGAYSIRRLPWKPRLGEKYYFITSSCSVDTSTIHDNAQVVVSNCFRTGAKAKKVAEQLKKFFKEANVSE